MSLLLIYKVESNENCNHCTTLSVSSRNINILGEKTRKINVVKERKKGKIDITNIKKKIKAMTTAISTDKVKDLI